MVTRFHFSETTTKKNLFQTSIARTVYSVFSTLFLLQLSWFFFIFFYSKFSSVQFSSIKSLQSLSQTLLQLIKTRSKIKKYRNEIIVYTHKYLYIPKKYRRRFFPSDSPSLSHFLVQFHCWSHKTFLNKILLNVTFQRDKKNWIEKNLKLKEKNRKLFDFLIENKKHYAIYELKIN